MAFLIPIPLSWNSEPLTFGFFPMSRGFSFIFLFLSLAVMRFKHHPNRRPTVSVVILPTDWGFCSKGEEIPGKFCTHPTVALSFLLDFTMTEASSKLIELICEWPVRFKKEEPGWRWRHPLYLKNADVYLLLPMNTWPLQVHHQL